jgi:adenylate kinase family enzyme
MERYKNGKIYKIIDNKTENIYIGSTCVSTLALRLARHRNSYKNYLKGGSNYVTSFKILENNDYSIVLLEEFPCETKDQLLARERYYIENNDCINKCIPTRTKKEWKEQNREQNKDYFKKYQEQNQDTLKKYKNKKFSCECGGCYTNVNKATHLKSIKHQNYLNNKNKITSNDILNAEPL